jgi:hypothetical protein
MRGLIVAAACLSLLAPARAEMSNWLLGGRWVIEFLPCRPDESHPDLTPEGIEFFASSVFIHAPPGMAALGGKDFPAAYEAMGEKIIVHLSGRGPDMTWTRGVQGQIIDQAGYRYRRCPATKDSNGPVS